MTHSKLVTDTIDDGPKPTGAAGAASPKKKEVPVIDVRTLLAGGREAVIVHAGERYRLRLTGNDKLILTK